jgi:hypothetical protein
MAEVALVRTLGPAGSAALGPQVTAPPPLDLFHDLRWISVFHDSWIILALELVAVVVLRSLWVGWMVQRAWPREGFPAMHVSLRRVAVFYAIAIVLLTPWVVLLFAQALVHVSFLFFAALPPAIALAVVLHRGAASQAAGKWWVWRPTWRSVAWVIGAFFWLTAAGAVTGTAPLPLALLAAAAAGLANARSWYGVVNDIASRPARRPLRALAPVLVGVIFAVAVGGTALGFAVRGHGNLGPPVGPAPAAEPGEHPVLIAAGLHSRFDPRPPLRLPRGFVGWRFSYRGLDARGRPLPYTPADTQRSLEASARLMARQVRALTRAYHEPVTILAESEGALVARSFLLHAPNLRGQVDRLITLDMPSGVAGVYFPSRGRQGWGVGTGWGLRGFSKLLNALGPLDLSADSPLVRDLLDCREAFARLAASPPPSGVSEVAVEALADWVDPPAEAPEGVPRFVVAATHGGLVGDPAVQRLIRGVLDGDAADLRPRAPTMWARLVGASASPWLVPSLPPGIATGGICPPGD